MKTKIKLDYDSEAGSKINEIRKSLTSIRKSVIGNDYIFVRTTFASPTSISLSFGNTSFDVDFCIPFACEDLNLTRSKGVVFFGEKSIDIILTLIKKINFNKIKVPASLPKKIDFDKKYSKELITPRKPSEVAASLPRKRSSGF